MELQTPDIFNIGAAEVSATKGEFCSVFTPVFNTISYIIYYMLVLVLGGFFTSFLSESKKDGSYRLDKPNMN